MLNYAAYMGYLILSQILKIRHFTQGYTTKKMWLGKLKPNINSKALAFYGLSGALVPMRREEGSQEYRLLRPLLFTYHFFNQF